MRRKQRAKLLAIADAATAVFSARGTSAAGVAEVARAAGVSVGTLYLYAKDKRALLVLALDDALGGADRVARHLPALPVPAPDEADLPRQLAADLTARADWPRLTAALALRGPAARAALPGVIGEMYGIIARERRLITLLDAVARDEPAIAEAYEMPFRGAYMRDFACYADGLRADPAPPGTARAVIEMVAWMAMRRVGAGDETGLDDATACAACVAVATGGLSGPA